ncbi:transposase [Microbulbifer sp. OS29]|uniref:Transposase n=1 Tax=Microbulbifer okhotskensis TaxID=2926617 RepID=A0A9X2EP09_9GAMM|nr:transposase [Microbulbifer okhotskensis]MCO1335764.1 transposase [Microbulbifer okhotskensis]
MANSRKIKAQIRAKVEHPFRYIKNIFGYIQVRYRSLKKNTQRLCIPSGFTNLLIGKNISLRRGSASKIRKMRILDKEIAENLRKNLMGA